MEEDARRLPAQDQHRLRKQVIWSFKRSGDRRLVSEETGLSYRGLLRHIQHHHREG